MDPLQERSMLLMAMYISTTVLLIVGKDFCDECDYSSDDYNCASCCLIDKICEYPNRHQVFTIPQRNCKFIPINTMSNTCSGHTNCNEGRSWFKAEKCGNITGMKEIDEERVFYTGHGFCPSDQGKYFCLMNREDGCNISNSNTLSVVVTMQGVDTYLGTFKLHGNIEEITCRCPRMRYIEKCVNKQLCCQGDNVMCSFVLQHVTTQSGRYVEGHLYIPDTLNISSLQMYHSVTGPHQEISFTCDGSDGPHLTLTNGTFEHVSFCESESVSNDSVGTLTFFKTNIGKNATSNEVCEDGTPRASRLCQGDFITLSSWAAPERKNCTLKNENDDSKEVAVTRKVDRTLSTVPATNVSEGTTSVTTVNTTNATTPFREYVNDNFPVTEENVDEVSRMLSEDTKSPENVDVVKLMWVAERLKNISEIGSSSPEVTRHVMQVVDNLVNVKEDVYEESLSGGTPAMILSALESQLTNLHNGTTNFTYVRSSLGVATRQLERTVFEENITFGGLFSMGFEDNLSEQQSNVSVMTGSDKYYSKFLATITLPTNLLEQIPPGHNDRIPVTFIIYRNSLLFMSSSSQERQHRESVESLVIAATVEGQNVTNLSSPAISRFQLPHVDEAMTKSTRKCVFWDFTLANGLGDWSSEGCELVSAADDNTDSIIECHCNHLTNFAVLLDVQGDIDHIALDILSIIGCVVSIFALVITLIVLLAVKKLREQVPQMIIINLCFALLGLYICFLVGIDQSRLGIGCVIFGALIHYFCLTSVAWMSVVATNMYLLFVRVFNADVAGFMWKAILAAWGLPMIVVVVCVILKHENYTSNNCFPQSGTLVFYFGVLLLIGLMLCYNFVIFILIVRQVTCGRVGKPAGKDKRTEMFERAQSIIIISVLLGLTWVFGFLSIGGARFIFNLLFLIFNSLQGFFVFVFFILRPKNVRMILFKSCYRRQDGNIGSYTVNKSKTDGTNDQKDALDMDAVVVTTSEQNAFD